MNQIVGPVPTSLFVDIMICIAGFAAFCVVSAWLEGDADNEIAGNLLSFAIPTTFTAVSEPVFTYSLQRTRSLKIARLLAGVAEDEVRGPGGSTRPEVDHSRAA